MHDLGDRGRRRRLRSQRDSQGRRGQSEAVLRRGPRLFGRIASSGSADDPSKTHHDPARHRFDACRSCLRAAARPVERARPAFGRRRNGASERRLGAAVIRWADRCCDRHRHARTAYGQLGARFVGLSFEKTHMTDGFFRAQHAPLVALFKLLGPGNLRIGANDVDQSVWSPSATFVTPGTTSRNVGTAEVDALAEFLSATGWNVIYGVDMKNGTPAAAAAEASYAAMRIGGSLAALEIGNEINFFGSFAVPIAAGVCRRCSRNDVAVACWVPVSWWHLPASTFRWAGGALVALGELHQRHRGGGSSLCRTGLQRYFAGRDAAPSQWPPPPTRSGTAGAGER